MAESGSTIYIVHAYGGEWDDYYDCVMCVFTTLRAAVNYIEHELGAIELKNRRGADSREWVRWRVLTFKGDRCPYWGPEPEGDDEEEEDIEPTYPFDYVIVPDECKYYEIKSITLDSGAYEQDV